MLRFIALWPASDRGKPPSGFVPLSKKTVSATQLHQTGAKQLWTRRHASQGSAAKGMLCSRHVGTYRNLLVRYIEATRPDNLYDPFLRHPGNGEGTYKSRRQRRWIGIDRVESRLLDFRTLCGKYESPPLGATWVSYRRLRHFSPVPITGRFIRPGVPYRWVR